MTIQHYEEITQSFKAICVGSVIGRSFILTVKSCVSKLLNNGKTTLDNFYILSNTLYSNFDKLKSVHRVEEFIPHRDMVRLGN